jgi:hypothetical protein
MLTLYTIKQTSDGGNTSELKLEVVDANETEAYQTYIKLMEISPKVTEEVLIEVASNEAMSVAMVRNILISNPVSGRSYLVQKALDNRIQLLSAYMRQQIDAASNSTNYFDKLIAEAKENSGEMYDIVQNEIHNILRTDTIINDSIFDLLSMLPDQSSQIQMALLKYGAGNYEQSIDKLMQAKEMNKENMESVNDIIQFLQWHHSKSNNSDLDESDLQYLKDLAIKENSWASSQALSVLDAHEQVIHEANTYYPDNGSSSRKIHVVRPMGVDEKLGLEVAPNPAKDFVTVKYKLDELTLPLGTKLKLTSIDGKVLREITLSNIQDQIIIDTKSLSNGTYIISITDDKVLYKKSKLEVLH